MFEQISLSDLDFLAIGNTIQQWGCVYSDGEKMYIIPFPEENSGDLAGEHVGLPTKVLVMEPPEWERFLTQTDVLDIQGPAKAILRKSQRQIDASMQWRCFERDGYRCRYCGQKKPLTVDHVDLWEDGGASTDENLVSACKKCNKLRGNMKYADWIDSDKYRKVSGALTNVQHHENRLLIAQLPHLESLRVNKIRSR